jgi:AraC-like DNA-binding protein
MSGASLSVRGYGASPGSHSHEHHQVLVGLAGTLELEVEGRGARVRAGEGLLVAPGERHDFESRSGSRCLVLDTADALWARCAAAPRGPVGALAVYLAGAIDRGQPLAALHGPALLLEAWSLPASIHTRARRAIDWTALASWTQARLHQSLSVDDVARQVHLSASQFAVRCHEAQSMSPMQWLRLQRLVRARQLRDAGLPVAETARRSGYRSPSALTAALRKAGLATKVR